MMSEFLNLHDDAPLRRVLYTVVLLLLVVPFVQAILQVWPLQLSSIQWRFGAANALSSVLLLPYLGLALLLIMARSLESRVLGLTVGVCSAIFTIGLIASLVLFILDALQLKAIVTSQMMSAFNTTSVRVGAVSAVFVLAFGLLALAGLKAPRGSVAAPRKGERKVADDGEGLIVGREYAK